MIKKPWQIWSLFGLILLVVLPAMVWLTMQINEADRLREVDRQETELARRQAELQERINSALYRMDFWTTPLVAQEAARPYYLYEPFYQVGSTAPTPQIPSQVKQQVAQAQTNLPQQQIFSPPNLNRRPSPLLFGTSEYVVMHFQITPDNQVTSPQNPVGDGQNEAIANGNISEDTLFDNNKNLDIASQFCKYETLAFQCASLPSKEPLLSEQLLAQNSSGQFQTVYRDLGFEPYSNNWGKVNLPNQPPKLLPSKELPVKEGGAVREASPSNKAFETTTAVIANTLNVPKRHHSTPANLETNISMAITTWHSPMNPIRTFRSTVLATTTTLPTVSQHLQAPDLFVKE